MQVNVADIVNRRRQAQGKRPLPQWLFRPLARLIHQEEINTGLARYGHLPPYDFLRAVIFDILGCSYTVHPTTFPLPPATCNLPPATCNLPPAPCPLPPTTFSLPPSPCPLPPATYNLQPSTYNLQPAPLFVSNHPLGGLDGMILMLALHDMGYDVKVIVNDFLLAIPPLAPLFVPVNKVGGQKREYVQLMHDLWAGPSPILSFPAGACSRLIDGQIQDLPWRNTYLKQAERYQRPVIRIHFSGRNSMLFYRVAQIRALLHIPLNLEMLLLPREMFHARGKHFHIQLSTFNV